GYRRRAPRRLGLRVECLGRGTHALVRQFHGRGSVLFLEGHHRRGAVLAVMVDQAVVREAVEIGRELGLDGVAGARPHEIHPHVLEQLLGGAGLPALPQEIAVDAALVTRVEHVECTGFSVAIKKHELLIATLRAPGHSGLAVCLLPTRPTMGRKRGSKSGPWQRPMHLSSPPRVGRELAGKRRGRGARYPDGADHAERDQVAVAVVTDSDNFFGFRRRTLEIRIADVRGFGTAVAGAEGRGAPERWLAPLHVGATLQGSRG